MSGVITQDGAISKDSVVRLGLVVVILTAAVGVSYKAGERSNAIDKNTADIIDLKQVLQRVTLTQQELVAIQKERDRVENKK